MGSLVHIIPFGCLFLIAYIIIDYIKHKTARLWQRVITYSFMLYLVFVFHYTTGGFFIPPRDHGTVIIQLIPFQFALELITKYQSYGLDWPFWNSVRISFSNFIMLMPLGVYLAVLFNPQSIKKALLSLGKKSALIASLIQPTRPGPRRDKARYPFA